MKSHWKLSLALAALFAAIIAVQVIAGGQAPPPQGGAGGQAPPPQGGAGGRGAAPGGAGARGGAPGGGGAGARGGAAAGGQRGGQRGGQAAAGPTEPAPRLPNGKPDLSGHWNNPYTANMTQNLVDPVTRERLTFARSGESFPTAARAGTGAGAKTFDLPYTEWGLKQWLDYDPVKNGDYAGSCMPFGMSRSINSPHGLQMVQNNDALAILFEQNTWFHWIPTNGTTWPKDFPPSWNGVSVGHWDGDTLIVETTGFNGYTRLDTTGHPHSKELKITNTFLRLNSRQIQHTVTIHDPKTYTKDWMNQRTWNLKGANDLIMEYSCEENNYGLLDGSITPWKKPEELD